MRPLPFAEWMDNAKRDWRDEWSEYFTVGGLPKVRENQTAEGRIAYLKQVFAKTYLTDIVERNRIKSPMENVIYNELRRRGWEVDVGVVDVWLRDKKGEKSKRHLEIDFVCNKGFVRYYIQSAFMIPDHDKMEQEQRPISAVADSFQRIMVVKDLMLPWRNDNGTLVVGLKDFLLNPGVLEDFA